MIIWLTNYIVIFCFPSSTLFSFLELGSEDLEVAGIDDFGKIYVPTEGPSEVEDHVEAHKAIHEAAHKEALQKAGINPESEHTVTHSQTVQTTHTEVKDNESGKTIEESIKITKTEKVDDETVTESSFEGKIVNEDGMPQEIEESDDSNVENIDRVEEEETLPVSMMDNAIKTQRDLEAKRQVQYEIIFMTNMLGIFFFIF